PLIGANAARVREIAEQHRNVAISALVENEIQVEQWKGTSVGLYVDVNPGMNRTGVPEDHSDAVLRLTQVIASSGLRFLGLHSFDGHVSKYVSQDRCKRAYPGYVRLVQIVDRLVKSRVEVHEVITAGTPAFPCSLSFPGFNSASFTHRMSPGTVVYCDS